MNEELLTDLLHLYKEFHVQREKLNSLVYGEFLDTEMYSFQDFFKKYLKIHERNLIILFHEFERGKISVENMANKLIVTQTISE